MLAQVRVNFGFVTRVIGMTLGIEVDGVVPTWCVCVWGGGDGGMWVCGGWGVCVCVGDGGCACACVGGMGGYVSMCVCVCGGGFKVMAPVLPTGHCLNTMM